MMQKDLKFLKEDFFKMETSELAKSLLGKILINEIDGEFISGRIIETEAYLPENDQACHAYLGMTSRNEAMFLEGGSVYVYLIYGMHYCFNIVSESQGKGCAVLIRALEPISGIKKMKENRGKNNLKDLCSGPAKLFQALGIQISDNKKKINQSNIKLAHDDYLVKDFVETTRVGISKAKELKLRYYINSDFISIK